MSKVWCLEMDGSRQWKEEEKINVGQSEIVQERRKKGSRTSGRRYRFIREGDKCQ
jgi:chorismate-pyruvate lyase